MIVLWHWSIILISCSGETQYNKKGLLQGRVWLTSGDQLLYSYSILSLCLLLSFPVLHIGQAIDSPLSEIGMQQAEAAGHYLKDVKFSNMFVSDMLRAQQVRCFIFSQWKYVSSDEKRMNEWMNENTTGHLFYCIIECNRNTLHIIH